MTCPFSPEDKVAYAYGELDPEQIQPLTEHLAQCPQCQAEIAELQQAAKLCANLRSSNTPEPAWTRSLDLPPPAAQLPLWRRRWFWAPVAAAAAAAALVLIFMFAGQPPGSSSSDPKPEQIQPQTPVRWAFKNIESAGVVSLNQEELTPQSALHQDDLLVTGPRSWTRLELADGSRVNLSGDTHLRLKSQGSQGDSFQLQRGTVACQVSPRKVERPFTILTRAGKVTVKGTLFVVHLAEDGSLEVGVKEGSVAVLPAGLPDYQEALVRSGQSALLPATGEPMQVAKLQLRHAAYLARPRPKMGVQEPPPDTPPAPPKQKVKRAPRLRKKVSGQPETKAATKDKPTPAAKTKDDSLEGLVARLHQDTGWIFDDLKRDMKRGLYPQVLHKLENYLGDPESPQRDEATFLKAVCQEKMGQKREALRTYRKYLDGWPAHKRAPDARQAMRRIRSSK